MNAVAPGYRQSSILPPRGLLLALLGQVPLILANWPLRPGVIELSAGCVLLAAGIALNGWSAGAFRRGDVGICPFSPAPVLVTEGPFRLSRNPMYLGLVAIAAGLTLATGVAANAWVTVAFAIWLNHAYVLPEERFLRERFGAAFDSYARRVPRWLLVV